MQDFASTALLNLIIVELKKQGLPVDVKLQFTGKTERSIKAQLLAYALAERGPASIIAIGSGIKSLSRQAILQVLISADKVGDLIKRWQRLETYFHGRHRVMVQESSHHSMTLHHHSISGPAPSNGEHLVIAGLLAALMQQIGIHRLSLHINDAAVIQSDRIIDDVKLNDTAATWHFEWEHVQETYVKPHNSISPENDKTLVTNLIESDLARAWSVKECAQKLSLSTRTLQRRLTESGTNFQTLLRTTRANGAANLLLTTQYSLAETGFAAGYSDQAHFNRDFKQHLNMSPGEFLAFHKQFSAAEPVS